MADLCECVCCYVWAMRRLMLSLQGQTQCTDTECFTEHPGYEGPTGSDSDSQLLPFVFITLLWVVIVLVLFLFRPRSLRSSDNKPSLPHQNRRLPPSPPAQ